MSIGHQGNIEGRTAFRKNILVEGINICKRFEDGEEICCQSHSKDRHLDHNK